MGSGGRGGPGRFLVLLCRGGARGVGGARAYADTLTRGYGLCFGVGWGSIRAVVTRHLLDVGTHWGVVGGLGRF